MKAHEIMDELFALAKSDDFTKTCDTLKAGDPNVEVTKAAVSMFATPEVIREAIKMGAQLLIVHEPTYYNHMDVHSDDRIECEKRALIDGAGVAVYRYHDHPHDADPDIIGVGMLRDMNLDCTPEKTDVFDHVRLHMNEPITPRELAKKLEKNLGIRHLRICGTLDLPCTNISCMFGTPGGVFDELKRGECEILLTGEACEWSLGEYARDAAQLGHRKALIIMGHIGSERNGMIYTADILREKHPEIEVKYIECGEVYGYTD